MAVLDDRPGSSLVSIPNMASRENLVTLLFVLLALPAAYLSQLLLGGSGLGEQTVFGISFFVLLGVGVFLPQFLLRTR